jgi:beta-glucosidase/6-phospho-beta-glucosidase/beta-galactosidase
VVEGQFSVQMLDHYKAMIGGCKTRGQVPVVTLNHFTTPRWFAAAGWQRARSTSSHGFADSRRDIGVPGSAKRLR